MHSESTRHLPRPNTSNIAHKCNDKKSFKKFLDSVIQISKFNHLLILSLTTFDKQMCMANCIIIPLCWRLKYSLVYCKYYRIPIIDKFSPKSFNKWSSEGEDPPSNNNKMKVLTLCATCQFRYNIRHRKVLSRAHYEYPYIIFVLSI